MKRMWILLILSLAAGGCGGHYTLTAGDQIAAANQEAAVVVRLQRNDFFVLNMPTKGALMRFRVDDGTERAAYTDDLGYAAVALSAGRAPGRHTLHLDHMDFEGEEVSAEAQLYVLDAARPVVAVALDDLPMSGSSQASSAQAVLGSLARRANIIYLTRRPIREHGDAHRRLAADGYPEGPVLLWQRQRWHIVREGKYKIPRVIVEARLVSQLPELRKQFPKLAVGICGSAIAAKAFEAAGMQAVVVGPAAQQFSGPGRESWEDLKKRGIQTKL